MLKRTKDKTKQGLLRRKSRVRFKLKKYIGNKPRLSVFASNVHIYAQLIDDVNSVTLASASTLDKEVKTALHKTSNKEAATLVGKLVALRAVEKGIKEVVFDRGYHLYHGKIKSLADSARENGLKF